MRLPNRLTDWIWTLFPGLNRRFELRAHWAKPGDADGWGASWYFDLLRERREPAAVVDDKTWADLEFPRFFTAIDTTLTPVGRQCLFAQLRTYEFDTATLDERNHAYAVLQANRRLREDLQLALKPLQLNAANFIADMLLGPEPKRIPCGRLLLPWTLISIGAVIAAIAHLMPLWMCALPLVVNVVVAWIFNVKLSHKVDALLGVARLLRVANRIVAVHADESFSYLRQLASETEKRQRLGAQIKWLGAQDRIRSPDLIGGLAVTANVLFLLKFTLYARSIERFVNSREEWLSTFQLIGALDAAIAIAGFLCRYPIHCRPDVDDSLLAVENGYHAFIAQPVKNSIRLERHSALITGSNMTGKTTFIKMIAMNAILGRTLGICLADKATFPRSPVRALVRADQSVAAGKSRYFAESESIREFIAEATTGSCRMFVLDEPFSGTNTVERIAIAKAVLRAIGAKAQLLVTTHDVELQYLLGDGFELYYFQENPAVDGYFDHLLHTGASDQRNAIRVLERLGYPPDIIAEALATVPVIEKLAT